MPARPARISDRRCARQAPARVHCCGNDRVIDALRMAGQNLHRDGEHTSQAPAPAGGLEEPVDCHQQQGDPNQGIKVAEMSGKNMQEHRTGKHQQGRRRQAGHGVQPTPRSQQIHEQPAEKDVQCDLPIRRRPQRQHEVQPVWRIEQRRLEITQKRLSGVNMRVPKRRDCRAAIPGSQSPATPRNRNSCQGHTRCSKALEWTRTARRRTSRTSIAARRRRPSRTSATSCRQRSLSSASICTLLRRSIPTVESRHAADRQP